MNELELLQELRTEVTGPNPVRLAAGRDALVRAITPSRLQPKRRWSLAPGAVAAAAVAAAAVAVAAGPAVHDRSDPSRAVPPSHVDLADQVLRTAAARLGAEPSHRPAPHQWILGVTADSREAGGRGAASWMTFDGSETAYYVGHRLVVHRGPGPSSGGGNAMARYLRGATPMTAYDALDALPRRPRALLAAVAGTVQRHPGAAAAPGSSPTPRATRSQLTFDLLATLLWNAAQAAPTRAEAAAYHALALVPGVSAVRTHDALGRPAIALAAPGATQQLLLDPRSYRVTGLRTVSDGHWPENVMKRGGPYYPRGAVIDSLAWKRIVLVSGPGRR